MDVLTMLQNARIKDMDGNDMGDVIGVCIFAGRMVVTSNAELIDSDDGDGGSKEEVPEPTNIIALKSGLETKVSHASTHQ